MTITIYNEAGDVVIDPQEQAARLRAWYGTGEVRVYGEDGALLATSPKKRPYDELWGADDNCDHNIVSANGGGVKCTKCAGWCCY